MILKREVVSTNEMYFVEINTNDVHRNLVTLYPYGRNDNPLMQTSHSKAKNEDYIKLAKDIVLKYEKGDKNAFVAFHNWNGKVCEQEKLKIEKKDCIENPTNMQIDSLLYNEIIHIHSNIEDYCWNEIINDMNEILNKVSDEETKRFLLNLLEEEIDSSVYSIIPSNMLYFIRKNKIKIV